MPQCPIAGDATGCGLRCLSSCMHCLLPVAGSIVASLVIHCAPAAAQCIAIGPVCLCVCGWVGLLPR